ncbi:MAG TPA: hydantoinase B/oxoprolinase family protein [Alphaproteobacteria bacterium]|nr:hydantoinase B/oxoprolinase family protein [Alphaproteobacteria bacterium]
MSLTDRVGEIRLQVMWNRLIAVVEEQAQTLLRTAFSTTVREAGDLSAGVFDPQGRMVAQAVTGTPGHVNSMANGVKHFIAKFPTAGMKPGDHYITNDPWLTSGHLHDITVVSPVFRGGTVVALFACCCHQVDIGGLGQGPDGRSVYEEGFQIPIMKLASGGKVSEDLLVLLRENVRTPFEVEGDVLSYITANETSSRRLVQMMEEFKLDTLDDLAGFILARSEAATQAEIAKLPKGTWRSELTIDGYDVPVTLKATLTIGDTGVSVDYAGSSAASPYGINVVLNYCQAYTVFGLKCVIAPDVPNNAGSLAPFSVMAPENSILNVRRPWPVSARHVIGQMLPDVVFGCLAQAVPQRVPAEGASCLWTAQLRGAPMPEGANVYAPPFEVAFFNSGGCGASPDRDGLSGTAFPSGVRATPVEVTETTGPVVIWRKELRPDSGGAGAQRGGLGQIIEIGTRQGTPFSILAMFDRVKNAARGRAGGHAGALGRVRLGSGAEMRGKGLQPIPADDRLVLELPGGAGYGDPHQRPAELVARDVLDGLVSPEAARRDYGVTVAKDGAARRT